MTFQAFTGIKNTVTRERLAPTELETARNVDLDDVGQLHRRRGYTRVATGDYHSLFASSRGLYGVKNGVLGAINPAYAFTPIQSNVGADRLAYVEVGPDIYFASPAASGVIRADNSAASWGYVSAANEWLSPVNTPTDTLAPIAGKLIGPPPMASSLAYLNGRIYLAHEKTLWATELYLYNYVDKTRNYLYFETPITAVGATADGLYVGTETNVWYLTGPFSEMRRSLVLNAGVLPGSMVPVPADLIVSEAQRGNPAKHAIAFMTTTGLVAGFDGGVCYNLTQTQVLFPDAQNVAAMFRRQDGVNQYVGVADSRGTPSSNTRIGDYVDAEIRRFQGA